MNKTETPDYLTPPQIASRLGVAHAKVLAWISAGDLLAVDLSSDRRERPRWRICRKDLDEFLARRASAPRRKVTRRSQGQDRLEENYY